jgi:hypothetical protein
MDTVETCGVKQAEITVTYRFSQPDQLVPLVLPQSYRAGPDLPTTLAGRLVARAHRADHQTGLAKGDLIFDRPGIPICFGVESARHDACPAKSVLKRRRTQPATTG